MKAFLCIVVAGLTSAVLGQPLPLQAHHCDEAEFDAKRADLLRQRQDVEQAHDARARDCWQRFAVNACLSEVRHARREALQPVRAQELALGACERDWRNRQRDERLQLKATTQQP